MELNSIKFDDKIEEATEAIDAEEELSSRTSDCTIANNKSLEATNGTQCSTPIRNTADNSAGPSRNYSVTRI